jgi:hypothetical protein
MGLTPAENVGNHTSEKIVLSTIQYTVQKGRLGVARNPASVTKLAPCLASNNSVCVRTYVLTWFRGFNLTSAPVISNSCDRTQAGDAC